MTMLWLDDNRPAPDGWLRAHSVNQAIAILREYPVTHASLDHDLGEYAADGGEGIKVTDWLADPDHHAHWPIEGIRVHSSNGPGRDAMLRTIDTHGPYPWPVGPTFGRPPVGGWPPANTVRD